MAAGIRARQSARTWRHTAFFVVILGFAALTVASGQEYQVMYNSGQNIYPSFEGWIENPDGTFDMVFGYMNRNWEEQPDVPVGPGNSVEPGGPDRGQPTHFFPRRNRFVFRVTVPKDFGAKELVWTLTVNGKTGRAYATLKSDYILEQGVISMNEGGALAPWKEKLNNKAPIVRVDGETHRTAKVGEPVLLAASVSDDGLLRPRPSPPYRPGSEPAYWASTGLRVAWFVYRGAGEVLFNPEQFQVYPVKGDSPWTPGWTPPTLAADGKYPVRVTFNAPGTFVVRVLAHDGGLRTYQDVTVSVKP